MEPNGADDGIEGTEGEASRTGPVDPQEPSGASPSGERGPGSAEGSGGPSCEEVASALRPADARERVHDLLLTLTPPVDVLVLADAVLVASELVTNALRHGGGITAFRVALVDGMVEVTASDRSGQAPVVQDGREPGGAADGGGLAAGLPGGYGWPLVCRIAWTEVTPTATGKTIRAWIPLHPMPQQGPSGLIPAQRCEPPG
ncbi:ATP-binding protein [Streptomyces sp. NPDC007088]|uniref:ATP-binding protein n=1 Tax=Streptomyces sp. NPDC007088 TaxID=3364773 RepID=UPI0036923C47